MVNSNAKICENCGNEYIHKYENKNGTPYHEQVKFCSKSCASKFRGVHGCIQPDIGRDALKDKVLGFISEQGHYCTSEEICSGVGHSSKTFSKHNISLAELNNELGFNRPISKFQDNVGNILKDRYDLVEVEKSFEGLVGVKGHPLRVDFYIPEINTVVEADGAQHSDTKHPWTVWNNGSVSQYDSIKEKFFREHGIKLIRVPYKRTLKKSDIESHLN